MLSTRGGLHATERKKAMFENNPIFQGGNIQPRSQGFSLGEDQGKSPGNEVGQYYQLVYTTQVKSAFRAL